MKTIKNFNVKGKRVLVRVDFNVSINEKGNVLDDFRIRQSLPSIKYLITRGAKIILISHLDRPAPIFQRKIGEIPNPKSQKYSLMPVARRLEELLGGKRVRFLDDCIGKKIEREIEKMKAGDVVLLENLRFYKGETENSSLFAKQLAKLGDIYINDAFACCHRAHASIVLLPKYLPHGIGFLVEKELSSLSRIIRNPSRPLVAIIGGVKFKTKIKLLEKLSELCDFVLLGGVLSLEILKQKISPSAGGFAAGEWRTGLPKKVILTEDVILSSGVKDLKDVKENEFIPDIGMKTLKTFQEKIFQAKTVFWNGPLGYIEEKKFQKGTKEIAEKIIESNAYSLIGGGETIKFLRDLNLLDKFSHISTGGGAMVDFIVDEELIGIEALK